MTEGLTPDGISGQSKDWIADFELNKDHDLGAAILSAMKALEVARKVEVDSTKHIVRASRWKDNEGKQVISIEIMDRPLPKKKR